MSATIGLRHSFQLHPSRLFFLLLLTAFLSAAVLVTLVPLVAGLKYFIVVLLSCLLVYHLRRDAWLQLASSCVEIRIDDGDVALLMRAGMEIPGRVIRDSVVTPLLTVLNVRVSGNGRVCSVVIFPDSMQRERFRELRVLLKWDSRILAE